MRYFSVKSALVCLAGIFLFTCEKYPKDPNSTLSTVSNGEMYVGLIENPPFVNYDEQDTAGIEVQLVREFCEELECRALWVTGSEGVLMEMLEQDELHLVIGGIKENTPYKHNRTGLTRPYYRDRVMVIQQGENEFLIRLEKFLAKKELDINKKFLTHD